MILLKEKETLNMSMLCLYIYIFFSSSPFYLHKNHHLTINQSTIRVNAITKKPNK